MTEKKTSFEMERIQNGRHMVYTMTMTNETYGIGDPNMRNMYHRVEYSYGTYGTMGKSHSQHFHTQRDDEVEEGTTPRTSLELATEYITNKYYELWEKGYRDKGSGAFEQESGDGNAAKGSRPINAVGETYYMEKKDPYCGDECAFYQLRLEECNPSRDVADENDEDDEDDYRYHIETIEGNKGDVGYYGGFVAKTLEEALAAIEKKVMEKRKIGYKKKATPKKIQARLRCPDFTESENEDDEDDDDNESYDSEKEDKKKKKKKSNGKKKANKPSKKSRTETKDEEEEGVEEDN
jgi:hypothetical protein